MHAAETSRKLIWHGVLQFFIGLLAGSIIPLLTNPRMGLSAHLGGVMTGTFLVAIGLVWRQMPPSSAAALFWLALYGTYVSLVSLLAASVFGTSRMTPIAGAGHSALAWQEGVVNFGFVTSSLAMLVFCVLFLRELKRPAGG